MSINFYVLDFLSKGVAS